MHGHYSAAAGTPQPSGWSRLDPGLHNLRKNQHELMAVMQNFPNDHTSAQYCPGCGAANGCALASTPSAQSSSVIQSCWCYQLLDSTEHCATPDRIQPLSPPLACYCAHCFQQMKQAQGAESQRSSSEPLPQSDTDLAPAAHSSHG